MHTSERLESSYPSRRDLILLGIGAFVVAALPVARRRRRLIRRRVPVMGTVAEVAVVHRDPGYAQSAIDAAVKQLRFVDRTMTRFKPSSDVGRANLGAAGGPVTIGPETAVVIAEALRWAESSDGAFDPCLGKAVDVWDVTHREEPPPTERVRPLAGRRLYRNLDLDRWSGGPVVRFRDDDVGIDLGGIAKGYGVDRAVDVLRSRGIFHGLVNVGGDLYALGRSEDGDPWTVGVRAGEDPTQLSGTLEMSDGAVATSGDYLQFFTYRGQRYHHLLDPTTGAPRQSGIHSVTVTADRCMTADAAATAVFGLAPPQAARLLGVRAPEARIVGG